MAGSEPWGWSRCAGPGSFLETPGTGTAPATMQNVPSRAARIERPEGELQRVQVMVYYGHVQQEVRVIASRTARHKTYTPTPPSHPPGPNAGVDSHTTQQMAPRQRWQRGGSRTGHSAGEEPGKGAWKTPLCRVRKMHIYLWLLQGRVKAQYTQADGRCRGSSTQTVGECWAPAPQL